MYSSGVLKDSSNVARLMRISYVGMGLGEVGEIQNKVDELLAFKWRMLGGTIVVSILFNLGLFLFKGG